MGLREKLNQKRNIIESNNSKDSLDQKEITIILNLIKGTTFKGDNLEIMYNLVIKLQNQYTNLK